MKVIKSGVEAAIIWIEGINSRNNRLALEEQWRLNGCKGRKPRRKSATTKEKQELEWYKSYLRDRIKVNDIDDDAYELAQRVLNMSFEGIDEAKERQLEGKQ